MAQIKRLVTDYENWAREGDIGAHRPCPADGCACLFRHRHGWVGRSVVCGDWDVRIDLLRLLCAQCGAAQTLVPEWLRAHSPYPWPWRETAALQYVDGLAGYRPVAARFGVDYTVLWGWVRPLAAAAVELAGVVVRELLRQEPDAVLPLEAVAHDVMLLKARTAEKRLGLAHLPLLSRGAEALRAACRRRSGWSGEGAEAGGAVGWLHGYLETHGTGWPAGPGPTGAPTPVWRQGRDRLPPGGGAAGDGRGHPGEVGPTPVSRDRAPAGEGADPAGADRAACGDPGHRVSSAGFASAQADRAPHAAAVGESLRPARLQGPAAPAAFRPGGLPGDRSAAAAAGRRVEG